MSVEPGTLNEPQWVRWTVLYNKGHPTQNAIRTSWETLAESMKHKCLGWVTDLPLSFMSLDTYWTFLCLSLLICKIGQWNELWNKNNDSFPHRGLPWTLHELKYTKLWGTWVAKLVKPLTLDFCSGHDLRVVKWSPVSGPAFSREFALPLPAFSPCACMPLLVYVFSLK